jgi:hypothetical protein
MRLFIAPDIYFKEIQGFLLILDLRTERYSIFNPVATLMWKALVVSDSESEALKVLQKEYSVEKPRLETDLHELRRRCLHEGLLQEKEEPRRIAICQHVVAAGRPKLLTLHAWYCLFHTVRALSAKGLANVYHEYASLPVARSTFADVDELLDRSVAAFSIAENFFVIRTAPKDCLPRSLALFRFLRSKGLSVDHCIGVRRVPFQAHAWVEFRDRVVHDNPSRRSTFTTIARISG